MNRTLIAVAVTATVFIILTFGIVQAMQNSTEQQGYQAGYSQGVKDGAGRGYNIRDPTYQELQAFLAEDQTDKNTYNEDTYNCYDYTNSLLNNAFHAEIKAGYVWVIMIGGGHALAAFNTTDRGLIFIEPQSDQPVNLVVGQHYWDTVIYEAPDYNDVVEKFGIIW